jgi:hypothetical protein
MEGDVKLVIRTVAALAALTLTACGSRQGVDGGPGRTPAPSSSPYSLYTHCGINEANINGRWYEASEPLSDGSGNPPPGWGNPSQQGVITFTSPTEAVFTDAAGHRVLFVLRPDASGPRQLCS